MNVKLRYQLVHKKAERLGCVRVKTSNESDVPCLARQVIRELVEPAMHELPEYSSELGPPITKAPFLVRNLSKLSRFHLLWCWLSV